MNKDGEHTHTDVICETCQNVRRSIHNERQKKVKERRKANNDKVMQIVFTIATKFNFESARVKIWLGYQKGPSPFVSNGPLHLKHVVVTYWHIHIKSLIFFMDRYITEVLFYA